MFRKYENGEPVRNRVVLECPEDLITEQSHKSEVDINQIIRKHGVDLIQKVNQMQSVDFRFDDVTGNDFQEAMEKVSKAKESFMAMPSEVRDRFQNNPAKFLDFVQDPVNKDELIKMGLAKAPPTPPPPPEPVQVMVVNPETPTE